MAPGPSYWPIFLALGIVGIAAGLIYNWDYGALIVALPLAAGSAAAWGSVLRREMLPIRDRDGSRCRRPAAGRFWWTHADAARA